jgi:hypothetical protein
MNRPSKGNHLTVCASTVGALEEVKIQLFASAVLKFFLFSGAENI